MERVREAMRRVGFSAGRALGAGFEEFRERVRTGKPVARVAINLCPLPLPWGGGNQWAGQLTRALRSWGYSVRFRLDEPVDCIVMADPRQTGTVTFDVGSIRAFLSRHPETACVHRINEADRRKNTDYIDRLLAEANGIADYTVFVSNWLRDYHAERWFDRDRPHAVIQNGADPSIFYPSPDNEWKPGRPLRLVTHHWSDNWMKGFAEYQEIDRLVADKKLDWLELWVIGRWPREIRWRAARTYGPRTSQGVARLLRRCHVYVTASRWDPGPMHVAEGLACGLPVIYHEDGGGIVELGERFGVGFRDDILNAIQEMRARYTNLREVVLQEAPSGLQMCRQYREVIHQALELKAQRRTEVGRWLGRA